MNFVDANLILRYLLQDAVQMNYAMLNKTGFSTSSI